MAYRRGRRLTDADLETMLANSDEMNESDISSDDEIDFESSDSDYIPPQDGAESVSDESDDVDLTDDEIHASELESESDSDWEEVNENNDNPSNPNFQYMEIHGPKHAPPPDSEPIAYFNLFFTIGFLNVIVTETNRYAQQYLHTHTNLSPGARAKAWKNTTLNEIKGFIAVLLNMNLIRRPTIASYWSTSPSQNFPWFSRMFSRNRFQLLLRFFHLTDNRNIPDPGQPNYDPCARMEPLVDHANRLFRHHYTPHQQISIDESLIGTKNHTQLMQYLPNKHHHRWGIKLWMLCDSVTNYCLAFSIYRGAKTDEDKAEIQEHGLAYTVVMKLLQMGNYLSKGYHVFIDNFFTSIPLAKALYEVKTFITGTIRRNRKYLPTNFKNKFQVGEKKYFRRGPMLALAMREKKSQRGPVLLLSTNSKAEEREITRTRHRQQTTENKPAIIHDYNHFMGGIDTSDMMLYTYLDERRTVKYWKKVCFNIFSRMILNSYILYKENVPRGDKIMNRFDFNVKIIESLSKDWLQEKHGGGVLPGPSRNTDNILTKLPGRKEKDCCVCNERTAAGVGKRKRSRTVCGRCEKGLHGHCLSKHKCAK